MEAILLCGEINIAVQFEIRKVLFPLQDIKDAADEAGRLFTPERYFHWLPDDHTFSPEMLMKLLEGDIDDLTIATDTLKHD